MKQELRKLPIRWMEISLERQELRLYQGDFLLSHFTVSTALRGPGELYGSGCTPRGWHQVRARIGEGMVMNTVFVGRRPTGELYTPALAAAAPERDWILTRILWLSGLQPGKNRLGLVDTMRRYIYIHGTPDHEPLGTPGSHGCIRMHNADIMCLFAQVPVGTRVFIGQDAGQ